MIVVEVLLISSAQKQSAGRQTLLYSTVDTSFCLPLVQRETRCLLAPALQSQMKWADGTSDSRLS